MSVYGYTNKQVENLGRHIQYLYEWACTEILIDNDLSSKEWDVLISKVASGDVIVMFQLVVLNQSVTQLNQTITKLRRIGVRLIVEQEKIDTSSERGGFEEVIKALAEMEHDRRRLEKLCPQKVPSKKNRTWGRPMITEEKVADIQFLAKSKKYTIREVAEACDVSVGTAHKYIGQVT